MLPYILLSILSGLVVASGRVINGQLSRGVGPFRASLWNHVVGFLLLCLLLPLHGWPVIHAAGLPALVWMGGAFGALFVALNSAAFERLGAMKSTLLTIGGQMLCAVLLDWQVHQVAPGPLRCLGVVVMLLGIYLSAGKAPAPAMRSSCATE